MLSLSSFPFFSLQLFIIVLYISIHLDCSGASIAVTSRHTPIPSLFPTLLRISIHFSHIVFGRFKLHARTRRTRTRTRTSPSSSFISYTSLPLLLLQQSTIITLLSYSPSLSLLSLLSPRRGVYLFLALFRFPSFVLFVCHPSLTLPSSDPILPHPPHFSPRSLLSI